MTKELNSNSPTIKAAVASYWRYNRQCSLVAFEYNAKLEWGGELADVLVVTEDRHLIVVEVKTSLGDLRRDGKKDYHRHFKNDTGILPVAYFYFAVPKELANKVSYLCAQLYPYAGVLGCSGGDATGVEVHVVVYRSPKRLKGEKLTLGQVVQIARAQTATVCRLATKVAEQSQVQKNLAAQLKEYKARERLSESK